MKRTELRRKTPLRAKPPKQLTREQIQAAIAAKRELARTRAAERAARDAPRPVRALGGAKAGNGVPGRSGGLARRTLAQSKRRPPEPGEAEFKGVHPGVCAGCGHEGLMVRHHAVQEQVIRKAGGWPWDLRWGIDLGAPYAMGGSLECTCHDGHHHPGVNDTRLPVSLVPPAALALAREVLGAGPAQEYFRRRYRP